MTKVTNRYEFFKLVTKIVAYAFAMRTLPARIVVALVLSAFDGHWFIFVLQFVLAIDLLIYAVILLLRTAGLAIYEVQTVATEWQRLMATLGIRKDTSTLPPPPLHLHRTPSTSEILQIFEPEQEGRGDLDQLTRSKPLPEVAQVERLASGKWQVEGEELTKEDAKKRLSKYKSLERAGKLTPRAQEQLTYWQSVVTEIEKLQQTETQKINEDFSESIKDIS